MGAWGGGNGGEGIGGRTGFHFVHASGAGQAIWATESQNCDYLMKESKLKW